MQSPPASAEATSQHLVARIGAAWRAAQVKVPVNQLGQAQMQGQGGWQDQPSVDHQAVVVKGDLDAVGVLLVWGRFCVSETIIPEAQERFLTPSARRDTHLFGGLGIRRLHGTTKSTCAPGSTVASFRPMGDNVPKKAPQPSVIADKLLLAAIRDLDRERASGPCGIQSHS